MSTEVKELSNEELRLAIAQAKGWKSLAVDPLDMTGFAPDNPFPHEKGFQVVPNWPESVADAFSLVDEMAHRGYWLKLHSPFAPDDKWFGGFIPHGVTGWNGHPDFGTEAGESSAERVICVGYLAYLKAREQASAPATGGTK